MVLSLPFLLGTVVLLWFCSSQVSIALAAAGTKVEYLPRVIQEEPLPFELETGYNFDLTKSTITYIEIDVRCELLLLCELLRTCIHEVPNMHFSGISGMHIMCKLALVDFRYALLGYL